MSDPTWASRTLPTAEEGTISVQLAGAVAAPAAADELAFATEFTVSIKGTRTKKGGWIGYSKKKVVRSGVEFSGSASIDWSKAADAVRALVVTSAINEDLLKITFESYASGDRWVLDNVAVDADIKMAAEEGLTGAFAFDADSCVYTAATA